MVPTVPFSNISVAAEFQWQAGTPGAVGHFRQIQRRAAGIAATSAVKIRILPGASGTFTLQDFPDVKLNDGFSLPAVLDIAGNPVDLKKIKGVAVVVSAYDDSEPASGTVNVTMSDFFGSGGVTEPMGIGDVMAKTCAAGVTLSGTSEIEFEVSSSSNMSIEIVLLGDTEAAAS